jgi:hypothetical protein
MSLTSHCNDKAEVQWFDNTFFISWIFSCLLSFPTDLSSSWIPANWPSEAEKGRQQGIQQFILAKYAADNQAVSLTIIAIIEAGC